MKNWIISMAVLLSCSAWTQQFPEGIAYQAQIFGSGGQFLSNTAVGIEFNIRSTSMTGTVVWQETHTVLTNELGHVSLVIGEGTPTGSGTVSSFSNIPWGDDIYFVEMLVDENNSGNYISSMTQQLMAVPFAFHSKTTDQTFNLSGLDDVDTTGLQIGDILKWDGAQWVPGTDNFTTNADTAQFALNSGNSVYSDTSFFAVNCISGQPADSAAYSHYSDSSNFSQMSNFSQYTDSALYADTAGVANYAINNWGIWGNDNIVSGTHFIGTTDSVDLIMKTNNIEQMRILGNGRIGIGTATPSADFHLNNNSGVLYTGNFGSGNIPVEGGGTRLMWYPGKAAFRAGHVTGTAWNDINIGSYSFASGFNTTASGMYSVSMGNGCTANEEGAFAGGFASIASGQYAVALGSQATANGDYGIALGRGAIANGYSSVALGYHPESYADYGLAFGNFVKVYGDNGVAMGYRSQVDHDGTFMFVDQTSPGWTLSTAPNQFFVKSSGGAVFYTSSNLSTGVILPAGGGAWSSLSDRNSKDNIQEIDENKYLKKLDSIDVFYWNYISQDSSIMHIGPMAQDFYKTFEIGEDSTMINSIDFDGVNLILLKGLYEKMIELEELQAKYEQLNENVEKLQKERKELWLLIEEIETKMDAQNKVNSETSELPLDQ
ncbi:MAG: tail fiber domain-containing protein [Crocinitomicaceae bacterium]